MPPLLKALNELTLDLPQLVGQGGVIPAVVGGAGDQSARTQGDVTDAVHDPLDPAPAVTVAACGGDGGFRAGRGHLDSLGSAVSGPTVVAGRGPAFTSDVKADADRGGRQDFQ